MSEDEFMEWIEAHEDAVQYEVYAALVQCAQMLILALELSEGIKIGDLKND